MGAVPDIFTNAAAKRVGNGKEKMLLHLVQDVMYFDDKAGQLAFYAPFHDMAFLVGGENGRRHSQGCACAHCGTRRHESSNVSAPQVSSG